MIRSGSTTRSFAIASKPSFAVKTAYPADAKYLEMSFCSTSSSSTNNTRLPNSPMMTRPSVISVDAAVTIPIWTGAF